MHEWERRCLAINSLNSQIIIIYYFFFEILKILNDMYLFPTIFDNDK